MKTPIIPSKFSTFHDLRTSQEVWLLQTDLELCSFQLTEKLVNDYLKLSIASLCQVCVLGSLLIYREASPPLFLSFLLRQIANKNLELDKNPELDFHNCFTYFTLKCHWFILLFQMQGANTSERLPSEEGHVKLCP